MQRTQRDSASGGPWRGGPGFVDPYVGRQPCTRVHKHGFTFRWCQGDAWVGVLRGTVVDGQRVLVRHDTLEGQRVVQGPVPVLDVISARGADWNDAHAIHRIADAWAGAQRDV